MDTSGIASAALVADAGVLAARREADTRRHVEVLTPLVDAVLADAGAGYEDLTHVAVGTGPGPFTGLRVGIVSARTIGFARSLPVLGVPSLDALALSARLAGVVPDEFLVAIDARRREVYWARYSGVDEAGVPRRVEGPGVARAGEVPGAGTLPVVGRGALLYPEALGAPVSEDEELLDPQADAVGQWVAARLAAGEVLDDSAAATEPLYLRRPDVTPSAHRKRVTPA